MAGAAFDDAWGGDVRLPERDRSRSAGPTPLRFVTIPIRNLLLRRLRSASTVAGVAVAVGGFLALTGLGRGVEEAWVNSLTALGSDLLGYRKGSLEVLTGSLPEGLAARIRRVEGVEDVAPELVDVVMMESGKTVVVRGWDAGSMLWRGGVLVKGRLPAPGGDGEVLLGESLAEALGKGPGDEVLPFGGRLRVVGVARFAGLLNNHSLVMPLVGMQRLLNRPDQVTVFNVRVWRGGAATEVARVRERLSRELGELAFTEAEAVAQTHEVYRLWRGMAWATSLVGLGMGLVIVANTMLVAVFERTREIGLLVAVGWSTRRILGLVVLEGVALTLAGGVLGVPLGVLVVEALAGHPRLRGLVVATPSPAVLVQCLTVTVLLGILGAAYPAWRASRVDPVEALRDQ